jgi:hypothetical protein
MRSNRIALAITGMLLTSGLLWPAGSAYASFAPIKSITAPSLAVNAPVVRLSFATAVDAHQFPRLVTTPAITSSWVQVGPNIVQAIVTGVLPAATSFEVKIPTGVSCSGACTISSTRSVRMFSLARMTYEAQLLAELNYLPVKFTPADPGADLTQPTLGTFTWRFPNLPQVLKSQWNAGINNPILRGAVMSFQDVHHMNTNGLMDGPVLLALQKDVKAGQAGLSPRPWNYVEVAMSGYSGSRTQLLTLYLNGQIATPPHCSTCWDSGNYIKVNTGISAAPTSPGTYPVYYRYRVQTMSGTNPDGSHYSDAGIQWVSYFNSGDALHEFPRYSYGSAQSLGCVEMSMLDAKFVWPHTPIGTIVTVLA